MAQDPSPVARLRVGHRERDQVAAVLQEAAADGRLSMSELDERVSAALQARTYADLDALVVDLGVALPSAALVEPAPARPVVGPPAAGYAREDPLRIDGGVSSERRTGEWTIPPFVRVSQGVGSVKLDCLAAIPAAPLIEVEIVGGAGSVVIVLPDGWGADADRLSKGWGSKTIKVPARPAPGRPLLVLYGSAGLGSVKVRPANGFERRRLEKAAARRALGR